MSQAREDRPACKRWICRSAIQVYRLDSTRLDSKHELFHRQRRARAATLRFGSCTAARSEGAARMQWSASHSLPPPTNSAVPTFLRGCRNKAYIRAHGSKPHPRVRGRRRTARPDSHALTLRRESSTEREYSFGCRERALISSRDRQIHADLRFAPLPTLLLATITHHPAPSALSSSRQLEHSRRIGGAESESDSEGPQPRRPIPTVITTSRHWHVFARARVTSLRGIDVSQLPTTPREAQDAQISSPRRTVMAEAVIFGGSPLDQYLQQAEAPELLDASAPPTPSSASGGSSSPPHQEPSSASASAHPQTSTSTAKSDRALDGNTQRNDHSNSISPSDTAELKRSDGRPTTQSQSSTAPSTAPSQHLLMQLTTALRDLIHNVLLPLALLAVRKVLSLTTSHTHSPTFSPTHNSQQRPRQSSANAKAPAARPRRRRRELCRKVQIRHLLVVPAHPELVHIVLRLGLTLQTRTSTPDAGAQYAALHERVRGGRASASPIRKACFVEPDNASTSFAWPPATSKAAPETRFPRLDAQGRAARNAACISSLMLLPPISSSWTTWLSTVLTIACLTWSFVLFLGHTVMTTRCTSSFPTARARLLRRRPPRSVVSIRLPLSAPRRRRRCNAPSSPTSKG